MKFANSKYLSTELTYVTYTIAVLKIDYSSKSTATRSRAISWQMLATAR